MKSILTVTVISVWSLLAVLLTGCGNTEQLEKSLADRDATIVKLEKENTSMQSENKRLKSRVSDLEKSLGDAGDRAEALQRQVDELREQLERAKSPLESSNLQDAYRKALGMFMDSRYEEAARAFEALIAAGIPDPLNDNCHYWIGESFFGLKRYSEALARFDEVLAFEWSNKKDDSQVMIARCYARMGDAARAQLEYRKLIEVYPASPYLDLARRRAGPM